VDSVIGTYEANGQSVQAIAALGAEASAPSQLSWATPYAVLQSDGSIAITQTPPRPETPLPDHVTANRVVVDPESFIDYVKRHYTAGTEAYADLARSSVIAILDSHNSSDDGKAPADERASWNDHKLTLVLEKTPAWLAWAAHDGKWLDQLAFAEHIEDNLSDLLEPAAATFLEIAQSLQAATAVEFKSSQRLSTGETKIVYAETVDAKAGQSGDLSIPDRFVIGVKPFIGSLAGYRINARFRYRIRGGDLSLSYKLDRPEVVLEDAFSDILTTIKEGLVATDVPVFHGRP